MGTQIGQGSFGCVFKAQDASNGLIFAVKQCQIQDGSKDDAKQMEKLQMEIDICSSLEHPNIVKYMGYERAEGSMYIFLEYVAGGSMSRILQEFGALTGSQLVKATRGCTEGLAYLHSRSPPVVHRDIKAANLLVDKNFVVKLADFGCSKRNDVTKSFTTIGSVPWMAPEVILQKHGHGRKADVWSLGCTVIEMATGEQPWGAGKFNNVMFAMRHVGMSDATPELPQEGDWPEACREFVRSCVQRSAEQRPRARQLLKHSFLAVRTRQQEAVRSSGGAEVCW